jgi:hypothetical protein
VWSALKGMSIGQTVLIQVKTFLALLIYGALTTDIYTCGRHRGCEYVCAETCAKRRTESCTQLVE